MEQRERVVVCQPPQVEEMIAILAGQIVERFGGAEDKRSLPALVGIRTGGAFLAARLRKQLERLNGHYDCGAMDITMYRDDWTRLTSLPRLAKTEINFPLDGRQIILVDDVLYTGRTVRAAMDGLIDMGRPAGIALVVLVDRGGRELPIQPDLVGIKLEARKNQLVDVFFIESGAKQDEIVLSPRG